MIIPNFLRHQKLRSLEGMAMGCLTRTPAKRAGYLVEYFCCNPKTESRFCRLSRVYLPWQRKNGFKSAKICMKVLLQDKKTRLFLKEAGSWTSHLDEAFVFINSGKAIDF